MATANTNSNPPGHDQDADSLSPDAIEETLCGKMRKLREDELFAAMDCMGEADTPPSTHEQAKQTTPASFQPANQVRRARAY